MNLKAKYAGAGVEAVGDEEEVQAASDLALAARVTVARSPLIFFSVEEEAGGGGGWQ